MSRKRQRNILTLQQWRSFSQLLCCSLLTPSHKHGQQSRRSLYGNEQSAFLYTYVTNIWKWNNCLYNIIVINYILNLFSGDLVTFYSIYLPWFLNWLKLYDAKEMKFSIHSSVSIVYCVLLNAEEYWNIQLVPAFPPPVEFCILSSIS